MEEDKNRNTGRTINAIMDLFLRVLYTKVNGVYVCLNESIASYHARRTNNLISSAYIDTYNQQHNVIILSNGCKLAFLSPAKLEKMKHILGTNVVYVWDHALPQPLEPSKIGPINRLDLIEEE